jgi:cation diffusion facilitator family transporter
MAHGSKTAVLTAIVGNALVTIAKFVAATVTGSASMMNEAIHSLMDTTNQGFLLKGLLAGARPADRVHAFGHAQKKYLWNLWSAIGLFSVGSGLGLAHAYHSWHQLEHRQTPALLNFAGLEFNAIWISVIVLGFALVVEGYTFLVAFRSFIIEMRRRGYNNPLRYLFKSNNPTLVAVVLEDSVAVIGLLLAALGIGLSFWLADPRWDVAFSVMIAIMLGVIAIFLGYTNMHYLSAVRDPHAEQAFTRVVAEHPEVEHFHDLRSIILDETHTILVAEVELREEAMLAGLTEIIACHEQAIREVIPHERASDPVILEYVRNRASAQATLERTESIIEELAKRVREYAPQISHVTIEVEGIATPPECASAPAPAGTI